MNAVISDRDHTRTESSVSRKPKPLALKPKGVYYARLPDKNMTMKVKLLEIGDETVQLEYRIDLSTTHIKSYPRDLITFHDKSRSGKI